MALTSGSTHMRDYGAAERPPGDVRWVGELSCGSSNASGGRECVVGYVPGNGRIDAFVSGEEMRSSGLAVRAFASREELASNLANANGSVAGMLEDPPGQITVVGPSIERSNEPGLVVALVTGLQGLLPSPMRTLARPADAFTLIPTVKRFLWPSYFPFIFYFSMLGTLIGLVTEKSKKLKTLLSLAGVTDMQYFLSWFIVQVAFSLVGTIALLVILFASKAVAYVSVFYLVAFFLPFLVCFNVVAFFLALFLETTRTATAVGFLYLAAGIALAFVLQLFAIPTLSVPAFQAITVLSSLVFPTAQHTLQSTALYRVPQQSTTLNTGHKIGEVFVSLRVSRIT